MADIIVGRSNGDHRIWYAKVTSGPHRNHPYFIEEYDWFVTKKAAMEWARQEAARQDAIASMRPKQ